MTNQEFINEFDLLYNNIRSESAPGIDLYETSLFLTKAQEQIVFNYFNPRGNKYQVGFENTEKRRRDLKKLIRSFSESDVVVSTEPINNLNSYFVELPNDIFFLIQEEAIVNEDISLLVIPITHDELMLQRKNPFRKPSSNKISNRAWRLDNDLNDNNQVEVIIPNDFTLSSYKCRYVKKPRPIILTNLNSGEFEGMGLSIDGIVEETTCELDNIVHRQILDKAVQLALEAFEKGRLQSFSQVQNTNE